MVRKGIDKRKEEDLIKGSKIYCVLFRIEIKWMNESSLMKLFSCLLFNKAKWLLKTRQILWKHQTLLFFPWSTWKRTELRETAKWELIKKAERAAWRFAPDQKIVWCSQVELLIEQLLDPTSSANFLWPAQTDYHWTNCIQALGKLMVLHASS